MSTKIICEVGINHDGDLQRALDLCTMAKEAGADYVKFQKRDSRVCVPKSQWDTPKLTPWGETMTYIEYREQMEFDRTDFSLIDNHCNKLGIEWFVSVWDLPSLDFVMTHTPWVPYIKIPSAMMLNKELQDMALQTHIPLLVSTGMANGSEIIDHADWLHDMSDVYQAEYTLMACHSAYPTPEDETNLESIITLQRMSSNNNSGFSSHSPSPFVPILAMAYAQPDLIEIHITDDRTRRGSDHAASLEKKGLELIVRERNRLDRIMGDGILRLYDSEIPAREKMGYVQ